MEKCVGCGFCCIMEPCRIAQEIFGEIDECPVLEFNGSRHICKLVEESPSLVCHMIDTGCGVSWNRWRKDVKKRSKKDYTNYLNLDMFNDVMRKTKKD